ncbi:type I polyketide synthase [Streptomyces sp.]|uniref:type I polyketide synthase n=1 Tax=Streptomyces sp. TaxID=1931 RepID=UPI002F404F0F
MSQEPVAVIGMAGSFPGAATVDELWANIADGVESITRFTSEELEAAGVPAAVYTDPAYVPVNGVLAGADEFDAELFGYPPREAALTDPQQRVLLQCAWAALENAGHLGERDVAVFAGVGLNTYLTRHVLTRLDVTEALGILPVMLGNEKDHAATRVAHKLGLTGPAVTVQTSCSTSLVAIHLAVQSVLRGEAGLALAGAAAVTVPQVSGYTAGPGDVASPDGQCRAFDSRARGMVPGNGAAMVVLKRLDRALADGDEVHAVIRGSAINNDGGRKAGYTAPSVRGQAEVIAAALAAADLPASAVSYVEAHGTATEVGDVIEVAALTEAFRMAGGHPGRCGIGSLKPNIGHLDAAAGVAGLIKAVLALRNEVLPPSINFDEPNPDIDFAAGPFHVQAKAEPWPRGETPRRCGVSSFGLGGTNAHVVLEEAPPRASRPDQAAVELVAVSAATAEAADQARARLAAHCRERAPRLADVAGTLREGRSELAYRSAAVVGRLDALADELPRAARRASKPRTVAFLFPGQGGQRAGLLAGAYDRFPALRAAVDECSALLSPRLGVDLATVAADPAADVAVDDVRLAQPLMFTVEYALARLLESWGVRPTVLIGHSLGEYVAAAVGGGYDLADAARLVAERGTLLDSAPPGRMLAVEAAPDDLRRRLPAGLSLAAVNAWNSVVVGGAADAVERFGAELQAEGTRATLLRISRASHCSLLAGIRGELHAAATGLTARPTKVAIASNLTGELFRRGHRFTADYWADHLVETVRFDTALRSVLAMPEPVLVEVGPGSALIGLAHREPEARPRLAVTMLPTAGDEAGVLTAAAELWMDGALPSLRRVEPGREFARTALPTYPFARVRHWLEPGTALAPTAPPDSEPASVVAAAAEPAAADPAAAATAAVADTVARMWRALLGEVEVDLTANFFALGGDSLLMVRLIAQIRRDFGVELSLREALVQPTVEALARRIVTRREAGA